jgi:hypothetical protein
VSHPEPGSSCPCSHVTHSDLLGWLASALARLPPVRMTVELGSSVRFLQRGIDTLAKTSHAAPLDASAKTMRWSQEMGDVRETWEMLAFHLEAYV